jgi:ferritin-like metal-binding protein YciE
MPNKGNGNAAGNNGVSADMEKSKFHQLFVDQVKDIYWAEKQLLKVLPKMQKAATSEELKEAIGMHIEETEGQTARLEQIFEMLGKKPMGKKCPAMEGLIEEGNEVVEDTEADSMVRDAGIILASQKIEHYEIASYGGLATLANTMGHTEMAELLHETLEEEKGADAKLTELAEQFVNEEAAEE